ncbi:MAG TPA: BamA/TamA family outer membrane protein [Flavisolibacter sp.]|nr:BamA/TamA family outer membrane protein [Flavisolibacter sp.]
MRKEIEKSNQQSAKGNQPSTNRTLLSDRRHQLPVRFCQLLLAIVLFFAACSPTKHIPEGDALYLGAKINFTADSVTKQQKKVYAADLKGQTRPKPNGRLLGIPFKLMLWNLFYTTKQKGLKAGLQRKLGEPPVLASSVNLDANTTLLQNYLENKGFFGAKVTADSTWKSKKASVTYTAAAGAQYKMRSVAFVNDSSKLTAAIADISKTSLLKAGAPYDLDLIKGERLRIDALLKERGFYYFSPEYILMQVDSTSGAHLVDVRVVIKPEAPAEAKEVYYINDVTIYPDYSLNSARRDTLRNEGQGTVYEGFRIIDPRGKFKPKLFGTAMQFHRDEIYNRTDHNRSLQRLMNLNVFKFVKNRFERATVDSPKLNVYYYLTPFPKKALRAEFGANTKSNNLNGTELSVGFKNRNTFRAGEQMDVRFYVGTEAQFSGSFQGTSTFRLGGEVNFAIPRFVIPFFSINPKSAFVPRTNIRLGYEALNRRTLYTLNSFNAGLGYLWKESVTKSHEFYPISLTYVQPIGVTPKFRSTLNTYPTLRHIIDTQFILGATYQYNYNDQATGVQKLNSFYFNGLADVSGNVAGLLVKGSGVNGKEIFGLPFSQYLKLEADARYYRRVGVGSSWANRIVVGLGMPYGNSRQIPYVKQFFTGGNNSIRAFRSRTVGPGTYKAIITDGFIADQTGDLKLELNTEFRPRISGPLYGALFVDAGNIWLKNNDPDKPGATFSKSFLNELYMGAGAGIRLDIQLFVIRLDLAFPIRDPTRAAGDRLIINQVDFGSQAWRRENLVFNLAIGYPF